MDNIIAYFNAVTNLIFGIDLLVSPSYCFQFLSAHEITAENWGVLWEWLVYLSTNLSVCFSLVVWVIFAVVIIKLLLTIPFKFIKTIIKKVGGNK